MNDLAHAAAAEVALERLIDPLLQDVRRLTLDEQENGLLRITAWGPFGKYLGMQAADETRFEMLLHALKVLTTGER